MKYLKYLSVIIIIPYIWNNYSHAQEILLQQCEDFFRSEDNVILIQSLCESINKDIEEAKSTQLLEVNKCIQKEKEQHNISGQTVVHSELDTLLKEGKKALFKEADYSTALEIFKKGLKKAQIQDKINYVVVFFNAIAEIHNKKGEYQEARNNYISALKILITAPSLTGIGSVLDNMGQYNAALYNHNIALYLYRINKNKYGEGVALTNLGLVHLKLGEYQQALEYLQQALEIQCNIKETHEVGNIHSNIGIVYRNLGRYQKNQEALEYLQKALYIRCKINDQSGIGETLSNIGNVYYNRGDYQAAVDFYKKALDTNCKIGKKPSISINFNNLGSVYNKLDQYEKALKYLEYASEIDHQIHNKQGEAFDRISLGETYTNLKQYNNAKDQFYKSINILNDIESGYLWKAQSGLAFVEAKLNQFDSAINNYRQAINNIETVRAGITAKEHKFSFMRLKLYVYDELIALLQSLHFKYPKKGYDRQALEIFERKQGRVFLEEMAKSGARRFAGISPQILKNEEELNQKLKQAQANLNQQRAKPFDQQNSKQIEKQIQELAILKKEQTELITQIKTKYPKYYALKYPKPVDLATLQNQILQPGEMMLVYGILSADENKNRESTTILWVIGKQQFQMFIIPDKKIIDNNNPKQVVNIPIHRIIKILRELIIDRLTSFNKASYDIYNQLLPPTAHKMIAGADTLYIVPTGPLYGLPYEALVTNINDNDKPHYLIQDHAIVYLSSASLLKILRMEQSKPASKSFIAFADPVYPACSKIPSEDKTPNDKKSIMTELRTKTYLKEMDGCFTPLPETENEVKQISKLLEADPDTDLYLGSKASRSMVFSLNKEGKLDDYRYVMFSVHGVIPEPTNVIEQPALVLSNPTTDGYLTMSDVFSIQLNADFVNLSACNTGIGGNIKGEGIRGLTRAFMYAGTPATAVTLWSVNLLSAKDLSIGLFANLKDGQNIAHALRNIKLKMIKGQVKRPKKLDEELDEDYSNPYHWAPFVVFGDGKNN